MPAFDVVVATFLEELFVLQPDVATAVGDHRHDGRWPDMSEAGHAARVAFIDRWETTLAGIDAGSMTADERIDLDLVSGELESFRFAETELREELWSPMYWVYLVGGGLHPLLARDFAPLATRLASVLGRLEGIPLLLDQARTVIGTHPTRPVSKLHAEVAARRIGGVATLARDAVASAEAAAATDPDVAALLPRLRAAANEAAGALDGMATHLAQEVVPTVSGPAELGEPLFSAKLRHTLRDRMRRPRPCWPGPRPSTRPSAPRWSASPGRSGRPGDPASPCRTTRARWCAAPSTPSPPTIPQRASSWRSVARSWRGSRRSAGIAG